MNFDTSWDVDKYKSDHECDEHWNFKRKFMIAHKNKFPEQRLVCLTQAFFCIEYLGCKYPQSTMDLIESLSTCMVDDLRTKRNEKLQRTLIAASDAVKAKTKEYSQTATQIINNSLTKNVIKLITPYDPEYILKGFILLVGNTEDPLQILYRSCAFCGIQMPEIQYSTSNPQNIQADLYLQNKFIASGCGSSKKIARKDVFKNAYNNLKENCFIIKVKDDEKNPQVNKSDILIKEKNPPINNSTNEISKIDVTESNESQVQLGNDNVGKKLLKMMGWTGGGLGKYNQGRIDPIEVVQLPKHMGLGNKQMGQIAKQKMLFALEKEIYIHIKKFIKSKMKKLTFSNEFTKDERELIHKKCLKFGLKTKSHGRNENRYIVISKKENSIDVFQELIDNGYENDYYILIPPKKLIVD